MNTAASGSKQVADGAKKLSDGLVPAGDGASKIADGLGQAVPGAQQIEGGAGQLSEQGTKKLIDAGKQTTVSFGSKYGQIVALNESGAENLLPYGVVEGDSVSQTGAFSYELAAANKDTQQNVVRGIAALALLSIGAGVGTFFLCRNA